MKRLYFVEMKIPGMVLAENDLQAEEIMRKNLYRAAENGDFEVATSKRVCSMQDVPDEWHDSIPYGAADDDNRTVSNIVKGVK